MTMHPRMVTIDCADPAQLARFWSAATDLAVSWQAGDDFVVLGLAPGLQLGFQRVPEPKVGKNRVHVDWHTADRVAEVERLVALGATVVGGQAVPGLTWTVLADPEGNEFCVAEAYSSS
jgi:predicted enzyme related to lactoylglutathione lyase